jgi:hypothetical protein
VTSGGKNEVPSVDTFAGVETPLYQLLLVFQSKLGAYIILKVMLEIIYQTKFFMSSVLHDEK